MMKTLVSRSKKLPRHLLFFSAFLLALLITVWARAEQATLAWNANTEPDLAGYRLHYGTASNNYSVHIDVHNVTTYTVTELTAGQTYYFAATAYDTSGNESGYSNQVVHSVPAANAAPTVPLVPSGPSTGMVNTALAFTTSATDPNGNSIEYRYDWGGGVLSSWGAAGQSHSWLAAGQYTVKAQARDSLGAESAWSGGKTVTISQNSPPATPATPSSSVSSALVNTEITFGTSASDPNGDSLQYRYDWGGGVFSGWGSASQSKSWSAAGQYTVKAQARDSVGAESAWSGGKTVTISNPAPVVVDSDGDGVLDNQDAFPNDPNEWADANGNGIGDNADAAAASLSPDPPVLIAPVGTPEQPETVSALAMLKTGPFHSPVAGVTHAKTRWQVFRDEDDSCVLDIQSAVALSSLRVPKLVLDEGTSYYWRAQFIDSYGRASDWSDYEYFAIIATDNDLNINGIPDVQEVSASVDLDKDGLKDNEQRSIKSVRMEGTTVQIGVSIKDCPTALAIESVESEDPRQPDAYASNKPKRMPFGLINFKIAVAHPGDPVTVKLYFSEPAPVRSKWFKYDPVADRWYDFSANARFAADRRSLTLTLRDGGAGDADGIANGVIVDPAGVVEEADVETGGGDGGAVIGDGSSGGVSSGGAGGGGCFISAATSSAVAGDDAVGGWLAIAGLMGLAWPVLRKRQKGAGI
jgi:chitinase